MVALSWTDNKPVHFLSTGAVLSEASGVPCPKVVADYHAMMGGVDRHDQLRLQKLLYPDKFSVPQILQKPVRGLARPRDRERVRDTRRMREASWGAASSTRRVHDTVARPADRRRSARHRRQPGRLHADPPLAGPAHQAHDRAARFLAWREQLEEALSQCMQSVLG